MWGLYILKSLDTRDYSDPAHSLCMLIGHLGEHFITYQLYLGLYSYTDLVNPYRILN